MENVIEENGEKTGTENGSQPFPRRRRLLSDLVVDDFTAPAVIEEQATVNDSQTVDNARDNQGRFRPGSPGGPGRGHLKASSAAVIGQQEGAGEAGFDLDLLAELEAAIVAEGPREFFRRLLKTSPVTAAQLLAALRKADAVGGKAKGGGFQVAYLSAAMAPTDDMLEAPTIAEPAPRRLLASDTAPVPLLAPVSPPSPGDEGEPGGGSAAFCLRVDDDAGPGWTSHDSIGEALDSLRNGGRRGLW